VTLLHHFVERSARLAPDRVALQRADAEMRYGELADTVARAASGLRALGVGRGDRVAIYLPKQFEAVVAMFAASAAGAVFVPINPVLKPAQVHHILQDSGSRVLVTSLSRAESLADDALSRLGLRIVLVDGEGAEIARPGWLEWKSILDEPREGHRIIDRDPVAILYTTGKPKGVVLSQRNVVAGAESVASYLENRESDRVLAALPFSFDYGFSQLSTAFLSCARVVLMDYLLPKDIVKAVERFRITGLAAVPPLWIQLANLEWPATATATLRYITNSGGAMPKEVLARLREHMPNTSVFLMYGLTEAFRSTYLSPSQLDTRPTSIGKAIPNAEVLVVRPDGRECDPGEPGELVHRGALVALGYWKDTERTAERFRPLAPRLKGLPLEEMAVWSGDTVVRDADGYLYFLGRRDEMIKTSGYRVSPTEIEEVVYATGLVAEAVAVGAPHPVLGQGIVLVAVALARDGESAETLLDACRKSLPTYMVPIHVEWRDALPRNPNGKLDRRSIAEEYTDLFGDGRE
jgi:acyl-CoA ligase (AMP-forming) (exosortase A-associated)